MVLKKTVTANEDDTLFVEIQQYTHAQNKRKRERFNTSKEVKNKEEKENMLVVIIVSRQRYEDGSIIDQTT